MRHSSGDRNLVAQLETIFAVTPSVLRKDRGPEVRVRGNLGGEGTPTVIGAVEKGLDDALGEAMNERKEEECHGDPVESHPQVLEGAVSARRGIPVWYPRWTSSRAILDGSQACWWKGWRKEQTSWDRKERNPKRRRGEEGSEPRAHCSGRKEEEGREGWNRGGTVGGVIRVENPFSASQRCIHFQNLDDFAGHKGRNDPRKRRSLPVSMSERFMDALCQPRSDQNPHSSRPPCRIIRCPSHPQTAVHDEMRSYGLNVALMSADEGRALFGRCRDDGVLMASHSGKF
jgi:hypothetical protein